jgi:hypothetical protein
MNNILTCVYCGMAYPEGTPPHGSKILTDHIKICEKHPMSKLGRAASDVVENLNLYEQNVPQTELWLADKNKVEVSVGDLRKLRDALNGR